MSETASAEADREAPRTIFLNRPAPPHVPSEPAISSVSSWRDGAEQGRYATKSSARAG
jgi:hypothetical protein